MASNSYFDLPRNVRTMVDDYSGPLPPSDVAMIAQTCALCLCNGDPSDRCAACVEGCAYCYTEGCAHCCSDFGRCLRNDVFCSPIVLRGVLYTLAILTMIYGFLVINNLFAALTISNTHCPYGVWAYCGILTLDKDGSVLESTPIISGVVVFPLVLLTYAALVSHVLVIYGTSDGSPMNNVVFTKYFKYTVYGVWAITWVPLSIYLSVGVSSTVLSYCRDYENYAPFLIAFNYRNRWNKPDVSTCQKFSPLGFGNGAIYNSSLPGTPDGCSLCMTHGVFLLYIPVIAIPVLVYLVIVCTRLCLRRWLAMNRALHERYYGNEDTRLIVQ